MRVRFWGVRGSIPTPGPATLKYGGNTPCVEIEAGGELIIVDAGSGIRPLGFDLLKRAAGKPIAAKILIGHTHWDHIQGFPFFTPLFLPSSKLEVISVRGTKRPFADVMAGQMGSEYFPVQMKDLASKPVFTELREAIDAGPVRIAYHFLNHPGITIGFRFDHAGKRVSYISDHEPYAKLNAAGEFAMKEDALVAKFVEGSDLLICEAQYTAAEYGMKKGWGHSTFDDVLDLSAKAGVKAVALFHHDPLHDDAQMDALVAESRAKAAARGLRVELYAAAEGQTVDV